MANIIKAPFNFVPLNEKVFIPSWSNEISQDIPFEDGNSGEIILQMEALSPIYVRNGMESAKQDPSNPEYSSFSKIDDRYFIPATSIKGMIRNVLEIMSFSKMPVDTRKRYALRDWENKILYPLKDIKVQGTIRCGWLIKLNEDTYKILDCDKPYRINHKRLDDFLKNNGIDPVFEKNFCEGSALDLNKEQQCGKIKIDPKSARYKYELINKNISLFENISFDEDGEYANDYQPRRVEISMDGNKTGTVVFTGQPDKWKKDRKRGGKFYEFIFQTANGKSYEIKEKEVEQFKFIYKDSEDWKYWKKKFEHGQGIPVFFRNDGGIVKDFGFSLLYKLAYKNSVEEVVLNYQKGNGIDLCECIFGYSSKEKSLKGRVQIGNAFVCDKVNELPLTSTALGTPKASYYPLYIAQEGRNGLVANYKTYNDGVINGWKRYPLKAAATPKPVNIANMDTFFKPLDQGTKFSTVIRFHNLKKIELGALLSALTFHGNESQIYHNIGMAKPQGYGKLKVNCNLTGNLAGKEKEMMGIFEKTMNDQIGFGMANSWINSTQIKELLTMAFDKHGVQDSLLQYMKLEMQGKNEFIDAKTQKEYLRKFSEISTNKYVSPSIYEEVKILLQAEENRLKTEQEKNDREILEKEAIQKQEEMVCRLQEEEAAKRAKILDMSELGPQFLQGETDFKRGAGKLDTYFKKTGSFDLKFLPLIEEYLKNSYNGTKNRDKKKWEEPFLTNFIWKKISVWVGETQSKTWFEKIILKKFH